MSELAKIDHDGVIDEVTQTYITEWQGRQDARQSIVSFIRYMRQSDLPEFEHDPAEHHLLIIRKLEEMARNLESNNPDPNALRKFLLSMPPAAAKSTYISVILPVWLMARNPRLKILCVGASDQLSEGFSRARRTIMRSEEWQAVSQTSLDPEAQSLKLQKTMARGELRATSAGSTIVGFRADILLCDDLVPSFEFAQSNEQLDKLWHWFLNDARTRLNPANNIQMVIGTRQSVRDPIGRLLDLKNNGDERISYMRLPLVCDDPQNDPVGRKEGERLWPRHYTEQYVADAQRSNVIFRTLYQQRPADESGLWCPLDKLTTTQVDKAPLPSQMKLVAGLDLAWSVNKGDYSVIAIMGLDQQSHYWLIDLWRGQSNSTEVADAIIHFTSKYNIEQAAIDNDTASKVFTGLLAQRCREKSTFVPLTILPLSNKSKQDRAAGLRAMLMQDSVHFYQASYINEVFDELASFPSGAHDDIVDAMSLCARQFIKMNPPRPPEKPEAFELTNAMQEIDGKIHLGMTFDDVWSEHAEQNRSYGFAKQRI